MHLQVSCFEKRPRFRGVFSLTNGVMMKRDEIERELDRVLTEFTEGKPDAVQNARTQRIKAAGDMAAATTDGAFLVGNTWDEYPKACYICFGLGERADDGREDVDPYWWSQNAISHRALDVMSDTALYHWFLTLFENVVKYRDIPAKMADEASYDNGCV